MSEILCRIREYEAEGGVIELSDIKLDTFKERFAELGIDRVTPKMVNNFLIALGKTDLFMFITPDGNRRDGERRFGDRFQGHREGVRIIEEVFLPLVAQIKAIRTTGIYLLSHPNLDNRSEREKFALQGLLSDREESLVRVANENEIKYLAAGNLDELEASGLKKMAEGLRRLVDRTANHKGLKCYLCVNYDAETELQHAMAGYINEIRTRFAAGDILPSEINMDEVRKHAWIPEAIDLIIRSGGTHRISGAPPNQVWNANTQIATLEKLFPQVTDQDLMLCILWYAFSKIRKGA